LAHELNNPISAIARSASTLQSTLMEADAAARSAGELRFDVTQAAIAELMQAMCVPVPTAVSPLEREDREEAIARWLATHHADTPFAEQLADMGATVATLEELARSIEGKSLETALRWITSGCNARRLATEIYEAASRIHSLVSAIKGFTEMD